MQMYCIFLWWEILKHSQNAGLHQQYEPVSSNSKYGRVLCKKTFSVRKFWISAGFRIFPDFFRPKPVQFHIDSGNLNFIKICWELTEEIAKFENDPQEIFRRMNSPVDHFRIFETIFFFFEFLAFQKLISSPFVLIFKGNTRWKIHQRFLRAYILYYNISRNSQTIFETMKFAIFLGFNTSYCNI